MVEAKVTLVNNMRFIGKASSGHTLTMDADDSAGGVNAGFRPMELLLVGFGGCSGMDVISILRKKRQLVTGLEINVKGERADSYPKIYKEIHIEYVVKGKRCGKRGCRARHIPDPGKVLFRGRYARQGGDDYAQLHNHRSMMHETGYMVSRTFFVL
jgi:putative redox protein